MPQAVAVCGSLIHICALRVTRLDSQGNVLDESNNSYVTNNVVSVQVNPVIEAGLDSTLMRTGILSLRSDCSPMRPISG